MKFIVIISIIIVMTILYMIFGKCPPPGWEKNKFVRLALAVEGISLFLSIAETFWLGKDPNSVTKPLPGKQSIQEERILNVDGLVEDYLFTFDVPSRKLTEGEIKDVFEKTKLEIDSSFLGENEDTDHIEKKVAMNNSYQNGLVSAEWRLDSYSYIYTNGELKNTELKDPVICFAQVYLSYEDYGEVYEFPFRIIPVSKTPLDEFFEGIRTKVSENAERTKEKETVYLPLQHEDKSLVWSNKTTTNGIVVLSVGLFVLVGIGYGKVADERKKEKERRDLLELDYSDMISTLSLLLGAGMSVRKAWEKVVASRYQRAGPIPPVYEEMGITLHQIQTGKSEKEAIEEFGKRTKLPCYKKMSGILVNFIQKGSRDITNQLNNEVSVAFEERKALAKIAGELAGTKLLAPMMLQLGVALVIIIVPAILSFEF